MVVGEIWRSGDSREEEEKEGRLGKEMEEYLWLGVMFLV